MAMDHIEGWTGMTQNMWRKRPRGEFENFGEKSKLALI